MSYISKQPANYSESAQRVANGSINPSFSDRRATTAMQFKQQHIMHSMQTPNVIQQLHAEESIKNKHQNFVGNQVAQLLTVTKTTGATYKNNLAVTRENLGKYSWTHLTKNVAYSEDNQNFEGISGQSGHSERAVFDQELLNNNGARHITITTERPPCDAPSGEGCEQYFTNWENNHPGFTFTFNHIINADEGQNELYTIYRASTRNPRIPLRS
jgi:hypothetical protein